MQDLMKSQKTVQDAVKSLEGPASKTVIDEVTICHLRPMRLPLNKYVKCLSSMKPEYLHAFHFVSSLTSRFLCFSCVFCKADELFTDYESKLFAHT